MEAWCNFLKLLPVVVSKFKSLKKEQRTGQPRSAISVEFAFNAQRAYRI